MSEQLLNLKHKAFVAEYLVDLNATQAAIRAGYSEKTARQQGQRLLTKASVAEAIRRAQEARAKRTQITADDVLESIKRIRDAAEGNGEMQHALKANELLGKHLKLFTDRQEVEHSGNLSINVQFGDD